MVDKVFDITYFPDSDEYQYTYFYRYGQHGLQICEETYIFKGMMYEDIKNNLEVISKLNVGEKLMVDNLHLHVDNRWHIIRYMMGDSRARSFALIAHTYNQLLKYKMDHNEIFSHDDDLQKYFNESFNGLKMLVITYNDFNVTSLMNNMKTNLQNE